MPHVRTKCDYRLLYILYRKQRYKQHSSQYDYKVLVDKHIADKCKNTGICAHIFIYYVNEHRV